MVNNLYRNPSPSERNFFDLLTAAEFPGVLDVKLQLDTCSVRTLDEFGSLEIKTTGDHLANVRFRVPVELYGYDSDGVQVHVLLHVIDGICSELEIYKDVPGVIISMPDRWDYFVPSET